MLKGLFGSHLKSKMKRFILNLRFQPQDIHIQSGKALFFVTGRGKSGTTWMAKLLNSHPSLFCDPTENFGFHQGFEFQYLSNYPQLLFNSIEDHLRDKTWKLIKNGLITNLISRCDKLSAQKLGDKTPDQDILRILDMFPETHIIVMLRDFRDVCVSWAFHMYRISGSWKGLFDSPEKKALDNRILRDLLSYYENKKDFELYSHLASERPEQVIIIRYEDMKRDSLTTLKQAFEFLGVESTEHCVKECIRLNTFEKAAAGRKPGEEDPKSFLRKGIVGDWQNHFSPENIAIFKEISGNLLINAGYEKDNQWG